MRFSGMDMKGINMVFAAIPKAMKQVWGNRNWHNIAKWLPYLEFLLFVSFVDEGRSEEGLLD